MPPARADRRILEHAMTDKEARRLVDALIGAAMNVALAQDSMLAPASTLAAENRRLMDATSAVLSAMPGTHLHEHEALLLVSAHYYASREEALSERLGTPEQHDKAKTSQIHAKRALLAALGVKLS
jgi:hypothetical protein